MKPTFKIILLLFVSAGVLLSGCQSGFIKQPDLSRLKPDLSRLKPDLSRIKKPNLGRLAFWKNENLRLAAKKDEVLPPSVHFSPDTKEGSGTKNKMKASIDQIIAEAKKSKSENQSVSTDPIRKPYSLKSIDSKVGDSATTSNDFVSKKLNQIQSTTSQALGAAENVAKNTESAVANAANTFSGWKNTLQESSQDQVKQIAGEFKSQTKNTIANTGKTLNQFVGDSEKAVNTTVSNVKNSIDNAFQASSKAANSFLAKPRTKTAILSPIAEQSASNDFNSKYKQVSQGQEAEKPNGRSSIQQSSFDAELKKNSLQPVRQASATQYPSTSFAKFQPLSPAGKGDQLKSLEVPPQLLRGNASFSPGSTKPLRPVTPDK